jgi:hypothetical protein
MRRDVFRRLAGLASVVMAPLGRRLAERER